RCSRAVHARRLREDADGSVHDLRQQHAARFDRAAVAGPARRSRHVPRLAVARVDRVRLARGWCSARAVGTWSVQRASTTCRCGWHVVGANVRSRAGTISAVVRVHPLVEQAMATLSRLADTPAASDAAHHAITELEAAWDRPLAVGIGGEVPARTELFNVVCGDKLFDPYTRALGSAALR